jgi:hypothetical protein
MSGHMPQMGHDTETERLTDCQSQCDFDFFGFEGSQAGPARPSGKGICEVG